MFDQELPKMDQKILIVDAHPVYSKKIESFLRGLTFQNVALCHSGSDGISFAERLAPRLVISSGMLPDLASTEVCRKIREMMPSTGIIIQVGLFFSSEDVAQFRSAGADIVLARKERDLVPLQCALEKLLLISC